MRINKIVTGIAMLCTIIFSTGFTTLVTKVDGPQVKGNPDPSVGIVVEFDSTAEKILKESSDNIRFSVLLAADHENIHTLSIPLFDRAPHKFTLLDDSVGFEANNTIYFSVSFDEKTHIWSSINFTPFHPGEYKTEEELKPFLDEWITLLDGAGWEQHQRDGWIPFKLPTVASEWSSKVFQIWNKDSHRITLLVKRNTSVNALPNVYNLRVYIDNND